MKAFRVWSTWPDDPESDAMHSNAYELEGRAQVEADAAQSGHLERCGDSAKCRYVVREEEIPRAFIFQGKLSCIVMVFLGCDTTPTDVTNRQGERDEI